MPKLITMVKNYVSEETAAEDIKTIMFVLIGIVAVVAIGWFVWSQLSSWAQKGDDASNNADRKQSDPFGTGTSPFGN